MSVFVFLRRSTKAETKDFLRTPPKTPASQVSRNLPQEKN